MTVLHDQNLVTMLYLLELGPLQSQSMNLKSVFPSNINVGGVIIFFNFDRIYQMEHLMILLLRLGQKIYLYPKSFDVSPNG